MLFILLRLSMPCYCEQAPISLHIHLPPDAKLSKNIKEPYVWV